MKQAKKDQEKKKISSQSKEISIVIPAYNEEARLPQRLDEIISYLEENKYDYEIIIVDDGSKDKTVDYVKRWTRKNKRIKLLENETNMGKGFSVKKGMLASTKQYVLFTDSDKSTPIDELDNAFKNIKGNDIAIGSRALKDSNVVVKQPFYKVLFGKGGNLLIRLIATPGIHDTQCGFKLFKKSALFVFEKQTIDRWGFDFEILFIARKNNLKIKEFGVKWINDERTKLKLSDYFKTLSELARIRINQLSKKYDQ